MQGVLPRVKLASGILVEQGMASRPIVILSIPNYRGVITIIGLQQTFQQQQWNLEESGITSSNYWEKITLNLELHV